MSPSIKEELSKVIPKNRIDSIPRSFDIIGCKQKALAIIKIPNELKMFEYYIAKAIMKVQKNVTSVLAEESERFGEYRTRKLSLLAGDPNTEVLHKESGLFFKLDPKIVYFSPRESSERKRLSSTISDEEEILVMFSGVGSIPIYIAKRKNNVKITGVELNPYAHNYCIENIHLNSVSEKVKAIRGDVREICPKLGNVYERIIMPLPKGAYKFLDIALPIIKNNGVLILYHWAKEEELFKEVETLVTKAFKNHNIKGKFINRVKISQYSPRAWKIRLDIKVSSK